MKTHIQQVLMLLPKSIQRLTPYLIGLLVFAGAALLRLLLLGSLGTRSPFITLFPAVMIAALFGGLPAGLLVTVLSALIATFCWIEPVGRLAIASYPDWLGLVVFITSCIMVCCLTEATRRARGVALAAHERVEALSAREQTIGDRLALKEQVAGIAATVPGVIYSFRLRPDGSSCMPYTSPMMQQVCGIDPAQVARDARAAFLVVHPDDVERVQASIAASAATLIPWLAEFRIQHPERGEIWIEGHSVPQREADGGILWHGFLHDVTDRKRAEAALRGSEARFRALMEQAADGFFLHNRQGRFIDVNRRACESLGYRREELLAMSVFDVEQDLNPEQSELLWDQVLRGRHVTLRGRHRRKNGSTFPVEAHIGCYEENGEQLYLALVRDTTEREESEQLVRSASRRLELATSSGGFGIWDLDVKAQTLLWNERMFEIYGIAPESFDGRRQSWIDTLHSEDRDRVLAATAAALDGAEEFRTEFRVVRPDARVMTVKAAAVVERDPQGRPLRMIGINQDITRERTLESQLLQAQKMEAVGRLAGGVAHDFNNNLTVILGYAELSKLVEIGSDTFRDYLDQIVRAAEHSRDITQQLLAFSRNEIIAPKLVDLNLLIRQAQKTLSRLIGEDVHLKLTTSEELWPVLLDPAQVNQIVMNLAVNARDAMPGGGTLSIQTRNLRLDEISCLCLPEASPGDYVQLTVSDTGTGMDREVLIHIFEPFYTTKGIGRGTGLGLATVYGIVSQNGGFIKVYSERGHGSVFSLFFPRCLEEVERTEPRASSREPGEGAVLLVEDESNVRQMARLMLENAGYSVLVAHSVAEALELGRRPGLPIDCLVTDVIMPGVNGVELSLALRQERPRIGVVYMSGYTADVIAENRALAPGTVFLQKPFDLQSLNLKVQEAMLFSRVP